MKKISLSWKTIRKTIAVCLLLALSYDMAFNFVDWRTANRNSAGISPKPEAVKEAVVEVYTARTYNWRRYFAVHSWIAVKEKDAKEYTTYQVIGFYLRRFGRVVDIKKDLPDRYWYAAKPELLQELRGEEAERAIPKIKEAANRYPYANKYFPWPGPNSNTFISHIIREVPELTVELPPTAIGKDFLGYDTYVAKPESGNGWQFSLWGLLGVTVGKAEGIEFNLLGLNFGIDFYRPALKLPLIGRIGLKDKEL